jgi:PAS domain S-box-containing protein
LQEVTENVLARKKIEHNEEQLRIAIEGGEFGTFDFFPKQNQLIWSAKTKELFGLPPDAPVTYETYIAALHPEDRGTSKAIAQQQAHLKEGGLYELEYRAIGITDGRLRWLRSKGKATYNNAGEPIRYTGVIQDITKQKESAEKIRESNQRFRNYMKQAPVGITILRGPEYIVEMANDAYLQLVDKKEAEFVENPLFASLPEVEEAVHSLLDNVLISGIPYHGNEVPVPINRYGKQDTCYFDFLYHPLVDEDGKISGVIAIVTEVTEKVEIRKTIEERKRLYETITQNTPDLIYVFDLNYRFSYANEALLNMWGRTWEDSIGKSMLEIGYEEWHAEMHEREIDQVIATKKPVRGDVSFPHATLGKRMYDYILVPVIDQHGKVEAITGTTRDVTQQFEARKQIEASEQRFQAAVQAVEGILWTNNANGEMEGEQPGWAALTGQSYNEYQGYGWSKAVHPDDVKPTLDAWNEAVQDGKAFIFEHRVKTKNGQFRDFSIRAIPLLDANGTLLQWVGVHTDITERKQAEKELKASEEKLNIVIEASELGIWDLNLTTFEFNYSNRFREIMGYHNKKHITLEDTVKIVHPDYIQLRDDAIKKSRETGVFYFAGKIIWEDNSIHWIESKARVFYDEQNNPVTILGTTEDITRERHHQQILEESEEKFRLLADSMPQHIWTSAPLGNLNYYNKSVFDYSGLTP